MERVRLAMGRYGLVLPLLLQCLIVPAAHAESRSAPGGDEPGHALERARGTDRGTDRGNDLGDDLGIPLENAPGNVIQLADASGAADAEEAEESRDSRPLEPRYQPREPEKKSWYNGSYIFGITRSVASSPMSPAGKVPLFVLTVPLDIVCLPFAVIGGLFG